MVLYTGSKLLCLMRVDFIGHLPMVKKRSQLVELFIQKNPHQEPGKDVYIGLNDMAENQLIQIENILATLLPFGAVTLSGGSVQGVIVLY